MRKKKTIIFPNVEITNLGAKGVGIGKNEEGKVVLVEQVIPGDVVDVQVNKIKKRYFEGKAIALKKPSELRVPPKCKHFGTCGGCKWQHLSYESQLYYKHNEVQENIKRIAGITDFEEIQILPCEEPYFYRNKLEYTFSNSKWLTNEEIQSEEIINQKDALGFHIPKMWSKVLHIEECFLQNEPSNQIRNEIYNYSIINNLTFYDLKNQTGFLRQLMIRSNVAGELMIILQFGQKLENEITSLLEFIKQKFPQVISISYAINDGLNDSWYPLQIIDYFGTGYLTEKIYDLTFKVHPKSFFQTNPKQAVKLYDLAIEFANLSKENLVYDLYTGTGTIAQLVSKYVKKVIGIESVDDAIQAAKLSAKENNILNCEFFCGDMKDIFTNEFVTQNGTPDVIITDPPRDGMHKKVVEQILFLQPKKIIYISCNSATQARDLEILKNDFQLIKLQAVDMFPQTHHVESVALLERK